MSMVTNTLGRYFAGRFVVSAVGVFISIFVLLVLVDYIEMVRKTSGLVGASPIMVAEKFGTWVEKSMYGRKYMGIERSTFLIDRDGKIARAWRKVSVTGHAADVLTAAKALG